MEPLLTACAVAVGRWVFSSEAHLDAGCPYVEVYPRVMANYFDCPKSAEVVPAAAAAAAGVFHWSEFHAISTVGFRFLPASAVPYVQSAAVDWFYLETLGSQVR